MVELPLVLAGPLLKRSEPDRVRVMLVLSEPIGYTDNAGSTLKSIQLELYGLETVVKFYAISSSDRISTSIGTSDLARFADDPRSSSNLHHFSPCAQVHVYILEAYPFDKENGFPRGEILGYEVFLKFEQNNVARLFGLCEHLSYRDAELKEWPARPAPVYCRGYTDEVRYRGGDIARSESYFDCEWRPCPLVVSQETGDFIFSLPTLLLQNTEEELRILSGSCLKLHGAGESALRQMYSSTGVSHLGTTADRASNRPHALVLLGDQIYADDVSHTLAACLAEYVKRVEEVEASEPPAELLGLDLSLGWSVRRHLFGEPANSDVPSAHPFSAESGVDNHLISASEFSFYYLMHLNPSLWRLDEFGPSTFSDDLASRVSVEYTRLQRSRIEIKNIVTVQANIPVYPICDDHEVTDDFLFDDEWIKKIRPSATSEQFRIAKYITTNALYCYYAFQHAGAAQEIRQLRGRPLSYDVDLLEQLLDIELTYTIPTKPTILLLDSRLSRLEGAQYSSNVSRGTFFEHASTTSSGTALGYTITRRYVRSPLMTLTTKERMSRLLRDLPRTGSVFIATPMPFLSLDGLAALKSTVKWDPLARDEEGWRDNFTNFYAVIDSLLDAGLTRIYFISGDVHYSYTRAAKIVKRAGNRTIAALDVRQIVTSPLLNEFERTYGAGKNRFFNGVADLMQGSRTGTLYCVPPTQHLESNNWVIQSSDPNPNRVGLLHYVEQYYEWPTESEQRIKWTNNFVLASIGPETDLTYFTSNT